MLKIRYFRNTVTALIVGAICLGSTQIYAELGDQILKKGMTHNDVKTLQQNLTDLGYFKYDGLTTYYGDYTEEAIIAFQNSLELEPNGIFDSNTYETMRSIMNTTDEMETEEVIQSEIEEENNDDPDKYKLIIDRSLKFGYSGLDVNALQEVLKALGYLKIENTTNYFGKQTEEAVKKFQENLGLEVDGSAGPQTIDSLNRLLIRKGLRISMPNRSNLGRQTLGDQIVSTAKKYIGVRYRGGGSTPNGFDCTGYTQYVYNQYNISLPRTTNEQAKIGTVLSKSELQVGDLVIFKNTYKSGPSHAGIYIGNGQFIHSSSSRGIRIDSLDDSYWVNKFHSGRKIF